MLKHKQCSFALNEDRNFIWDVTIKCFKICLYVSIIKMSCLQLFPGCFVTNAEFAFNNRRACKWQGGAGEDLESSGSLTWGESWGSFTGESGKPGASCLRRGFYAVGCSTYDLDSVSFLLPPKPEAHQRGLGTAQAKPVIRSPSFWQTDAWL